MTKMRGEKKKPSQIVLIALIFKQTILSKCYTFTKGSPEPTYKLLGRLLFKHKNVDLKMQSSNLNQICEGAN